MVDEFFVDPAQLLYRRFDRQTNPLVAEVSPTTQTSLPAGPRPISTNCTAAWARAGRLTIGRPGAVRQMNRKRELHEKLNMLLESSHAELAAGILNVLYETAVVSN